MADSRQPTMVSLEMTVIRADGTIEPKGAVAYWHRNPVRRWAWRLRRIFARR